MWWLRISIQTNKLRPVTLPLLLKQVDRGKIPVCLISGPSTLLKRPSVSFDPRLGLLLDPKDQTEGSNKNPVDNRRFEPKEKSVKISIVPLFYTHESHKKNEIK